ncbi:glycerol dehydrogenase [Herbiconiux ginsengi]|uniref:Glycerol dehydrogenase n=1 Tax=Herbiconiux ginsengi TaxID=381665 RepID=A0A1H3NEN5_9MICO|nr:glycerol dehydrogenase [Herbiconiux ginsengi]SDY86649.1 glycerol dehydrogenase [Herbiconiux ginsengi]
MTEMGSRTGIRVFGTAARYVQGPGALAQIGRHAAGIGSSALVLVDAFMLPVLAPVIEASFAEAGLQARCRSVASEVTEAAIAAVTANVPAGTDFVVGVGGGKTIDIAKGTSRRLDLPVVTVPTIASNDSPASRAIALYDDAHQLIEVPLLRRNPALVLVDTEVIAGAPARFLSAGIGDALSKHFEVEACRAAGGITMQGTRGLRVAAIVAAGCYEVLRSQAVRALAALEAGVIDDAFEDTVEAVVLLSGLAFENGGLSLAHAVTRGLMAVPGAASRLHGEHVAYGLLVQLAVLGESDAAIRDLASFLDEVGLPRSLSELGAAPTDEAYDAVAARTLTAPHVVNLPEPLTQPALVAALRRVERLAH